MAKQAPKKRQLKKVETVRQRSERVGSTPAGTRKGSKVWKVVSKPLRITGRFIAKVLSPFAFVLIPFKTKPMRFIGQMLASVLLFRFFRDAWKELRQVQWPSARETVRLSMAVFMFSIVFGVIIAITDYGLDKVFRKVFIE